ncbi:polysaccharide pyruvyl transferase family protein [Solimonas sp. SE-A11]|uniref:polysaccharide pyruvyl transferase family protein n=1 Tax=Solimonas sp. SE-A11 TaxID=3054954 RepID=UPI00259CF0A5|nr:polysaccharide pyruvyl transferase family protein [Solimonas sp. SE-A11]MDM4769739.1 polysaccharide pyruvyl transferase family protein [Solimonas sp. SE-A11]
MTKKLITAITRVRTVNIGNEALSAELMRLLEQKAAERGQTAVALERAPRHLAQFVSSALNDGPKAAAKTIQRWVTRLCRVTPQIAPPPDNRIELYFERGQSKRLLKFKARLQLRRWAARVGLYQPEFAQRLGIFARSSHVVLNPAGELNPESIDPPLRMLTELLAARQQGSRVGVVNFSYEITQPHIAPIFAQLFEQCDFICVRDSLSLEVLVSSGVSRERLHLVPDLVFLTEPASKDEGAALAQTLGIDRDTVAIVVNGKTGLSKVEDWTILIDRIRKVGKKVVLLSNELSSDIGFLEELARRSGATLIQRQFSYREYASLLSHLCLVVSNRLHTCVLAMTAGTPVVAIEPILRKVRGVLADMNYSLPVPSVREAGWVDNAWESIQVALGERERLAKEIAGLVTETRRKILAGYDRVLG